ncbi:MAG: thiamine pyrophosphate-dependent enzyme, partial [Vibrio sp.]
AQLTQLAAQIKGCAKGLVVIGSVSLEQAQAARAFAERLGWPVLADPQSGVSTPWQHYDIWLQSDECAATLASSELIVQFGARLVSKRLLAWIKQQVNVQSADYWLIEPSVTVLNPDHLAQQRIRADICDSLDQLQGQLSISARLEAGKDTLSSDALSLAARCQRQFPVWSNHDVLTECQFAQRLPELLNQTPSADLFLGNSLIVRLVDMLTCLPDCEVFTNRGASGIDGLLATAVGVQRARQSMQLCILGDTSTLYDLNSLALLSQTSQPFVLVVLNNDGGAIFDLLPVPDAQKKTLYQMPHGFEFSGAAQQFQLNYGLVQTFEQIMTKIKAYQNAFKQNQTHSGLILELQTPSGQAGQDLQAIVKAVTHHVS